MHNFLLLTVSLGLLGWSSAAYAEPKCGKIEDDIVEDVFRAAERVDHYYDVVGELENICEKVEAVRKWEKAQPRGSLDKAYKNKRNDIIEEMESDMASVTNLITAYRAWLYYDASGAVNEAKRIAKIRKTKRDTQFYLKNLEGSAQYLEKQTF